MSLVNVVKKAALDALAASNPVQIIFGEVVTDNPLSVRIDQRFTLDDDFLIVLDSVSAKLTPGARLLLLRMQGGQQYVIMDKVVGV